MHGVEMRLSPSGASLSWVASPGESPALLWNDYDRNPWERQPAARTTPEPETEEACTLWRPVFERWSAYLRSRYPRDRDPPSTWSNYTRWVRSTFEGAGKADLRDVTWADLDEWWQGYARKYKERTGSDPKPSTYNQWVNAIRSLYHYAIRKLDLDDYGVKDQGQKLDLFPEETVNREKRADPPLSRDEVLAILRVAESKGDVEFALGLRYKWTAICRIEDVWSVRRRQWDFGPQPKVTYPRPSKHGHDLVRLVDVTLASRVCSWCDARGISDDNPVFARGASDTLNAFKHRFAARLKAYAAEAGVRKRVHPHLIRASVRSHARAHRVPREFLDRQGGWTDGSAADAYGREDPEVHREWVAHLALD